MSRWGLGAGVLAVVLALGSVFTVDAREVAVVTVFGAPVRAITEPGFYLRAPWPVHQVVRFDQRARLLEVEAGEVLTKDKKNLVVESFVVWRVAEPVRFLEAVATAEAAEAQLSDLVGSRVAAALGQREFREMMAVDAGGDLLPADIAAEVSEIARARLGVEVREVRLRHVGLPLQNEQSIYERMRAERRRIANAYRSEGEERAATIRAEADRQAAEILAVADQEAARIEAEAEGQASRLYAESYAQNPELYHLLRRLEATEALLDEQAVVVLESDGDWLAPLLTPERAP